MSNGFASSLIPDLGTSRAKATAAENIRRSWPKLWSRYVPKMYKRAEAWGDYELPGVVFSCAEIFSHTKRSQIEDSKVFLKQLLMGHLWSSRGCPTFFVSKEMMQAAMATQPPAEVDWSKMNLPYEVGCFVFPKGMLQFPDDEGECHFGMWSRIRRGKYDLSHVKFEIDYHTESFTIDTFSGKNFYDYLTNYVVPFKPEDTVDNLGDNFDPLALHLTDTEARFSARLATIMFNLLLIMNMRPEYVESGAKVGRHKKRNVELWTPNIIGRRYVVKKTLSNGTGEKRRMHWRRGHLRQQPFGPYTVETRSIMNEQTQQLEDKKIRVYKEHKTIWIEPMLVGGKED